MYPKIFRDVEFNVANSLMYNNFIYIYRQSEL